ncbi:MAG: hypothetical protein JSS71_06965 [Armatimonadetes bacterium]|nr:hypothetical protein [Armatimonadota bacterium]MBX3107628.1 hypothetical protein [Fimbriimonadaceae bacterium]
MGTQSALSENNKTIDENTPDLERVKNTPFLVSDVITGVEALANVFKDVGKDLMGGWYERNEILLSGAD